MKKRLLCQLKDRLKKIEQMQVPFSKFLLVSENAPESMIICEYKLAKLEIQGAEENPDRWPDDTFNHILSHLFYLEKQLG